jgi:hypothetical protein
LKKGVVSRATKMIDDRDGSYRAMKELIEDEWMYPAHVEKYWTTLRNTIQEKNVIGMLSQSLYDSDIRVIYTYLKVPV